MPPMTAMDAMLPVSSSCRTIPDLLADAAIADSGRTPQATILRRKGWTRNGGASGIRASRRSAACRCSRAGMSVAGEIVAALDARGRCASRAAISSCWRRRSSPRPKAAWCAGRRRRRREAAGRWPRETGRPAPLAQLILDEARRSCAPPRRRSSPATARGHVLANAGIDASNVEGGEPTTRCCSGRSIPTPARARSAPSSGA